VIEIIRTGDWDLEESSYTTTGKDGVTRHNRARVLLEGEPYAHIAESPPGAVIPVHSHSTTELTVILQGTATVAGQQCGPGTILIVPADEEYGLEAGVDEPLTFLVVRPRKAAYQESSAGQKRR
jgi:quercetin dioxygenase-like cupin family protein